MLRKWTPAFVILLQNEFRRRANKLFANWLLIYGFFVFGCDGSRFDLPRTRSNELAYAPSRKTCRGQTNRARRKRSARPCPQGRSRMF